MNKDYTREGANQTLDFDAFQFFLTDDGMKELAKTMIYRYEGLARSLQSQLNTQLEEIDNE